MCSARSQRCRRCLLPALFGATSARADDAAPLASWNDGPAKQAILDFIRATTDPASKTFVPPEERIATFDQDGTLWVEHPIYTQVVYCLDRVPVVVKEKPELAHVEPFKTVLTGDFEKIGKLSLRDLEAIAVATLTGMDVDAFGAEAKAWIDAAKDHRWKRLYTELTYQPMQEVLTYFRANGYKTFIVTGGGQDFVRVYSERVYGIPPEQVVGIGGRDEIRLRQGRQAVPHQGAEAVPERRQRRQAGGHSPRDRPPPARRLRQLDR